MIQEIAPHRYDNRYEPLPPSPEDTVFLFAPPQMLAREGEGREIRFPRLKDFTRLPGELTYLFSIDGEKFFLAQPEGEWEAPDFSLLHTGAIRGCTPPELSFAAATAMQLSRWYRDNRFCGRCGGEMARDLKERMLYCPRCKNTVYPKISPCIITPGAATTTTRWWRGSGRSARALRRPFAGRWRRRWGWKSRTSATGIASPGPSPTASSPDSSVTSGAAAPPGWWTGN